MRPEDLGIGRLFEKALDAVIVADAETQRVVLWNPAATNIFGYSLSEALELRVEALVPEHLKAKHRAGMIRYEETGHGHYIDSHRLLDLPALKKGGEEIRIELSLNPIAPVGDDGRRFVLAIIRDVTQRKRAEERLAEEHNLLRTLIDNLPDFIFVKDTESRFVINNVEHLHVLRVSQQSEVVGKTDFDFFPREFAEEYYADEQEVIRSGEALIGREEPVVDQAGNSQWLSTTKVPLRDSSGEIVGLVGMSRDLTERKLAEEEIRHLNDTLEKRVVERTAQLAERESRLRQLLGKLVVAQEEERRRVAYEVHDGLAQMIVAVQQHLQAFAKQYPPDSSQGRERLDWTLDLAQQTVEETRRVIGGLRPTAPDDFGLAAAVRLHVEALRTEGWDIDYDETLGDERLPAALETVLYRVAQEALTNVRKHADTTRVRLNLGGLERQVRLRVRDWGRGFETAMPVGGDGPGERLGISGMAERITLLGGEFKVCSRPGAGTLIVARVPLADYEEDVERG